MIANVIKYAKEHSRQLADTLHKGLLFRIKVFIDMLFCFRFYNMFTNVYIREKFYEKKHEERKKRGSQLKVEGEKRIKWLIEANKDRNLFGQYSNVKYEKTSLRAKRNMAYTRRYNAGLNLYVGYGVYICRQHFLDGTITIGSGVTLTRNILIDYSGGLVIKNNVTISNGVSIETHSHAAYSSPLAGTEIVKPMPLTIEEGVLVGTGAIILETCSVIGRHSRIGAGTVVRGDVPPYAIMVGNPGKIVGFTLTPTQVEEFESTSYSEAERINIKQYEKDFDRFFSDKMSEIRKFYKPTI